jgi:hypothetical protein
MQWTPVVKTASNFQVANVPQRVIQITGVIQPMPAQKVVIKPEGQRQFKWWTLWTKQAVNLDDIITYKGRTFRVMELNDWVQAGYQEYGMVESPI